MSRSVVSLFSGAGGSSLGYKRAGFDVVGAFDCAPKGYADGVLETYRANHDTPLFERDVSELRSRELLDLVNCAPGEIDVLDGSPPCSPFSSQNTSGETGLDSHKGTLFDHYARLVDGVEPRYFVAENVPGLATGETKGYFQDLCSRLENAGPGYTLSVSKIEAHKLGSPHRRTRLIFTGSRSGVPHPESVDYTRVGTPGDVLAGVENDDDELAIARRMFDDYKYSDAARKLDPGQTLDEVLENKQFTRYRVALDEPCYNPSSVVETFHPTEDRYLTISELARIMGLPDSYTIAGETFNQRWEAAIRCLPPVMIRTVAETILDAQEDSV